MRSLSLSFVLGLLVIVSASCAAPRVQQDTSAHPAEMTPEAVAHRHFRATLARDWLTSVDATHPTELARIKATFLPIFARDPTGMLVNRVLGTLPQSDLNSLSDVAFNAKLYAFHIGLASQGSALARFTDADILGVAQPFPDTAYVVYRWVLPPSERPIRGAQVIKLQRDQGRWWLAMLGEYEGLRELLTAQ
jgi:hypothetical protein